MNKSLNILKCIAAICVINMHCTYYDSSKPGIIIDAIIRFAVPIFFMISGYYSYFKKEDINKAEKYKNRIIKIVGLIILSWIVYVPSRYLLFGRNVGFIEYFKNLYNEESIFKLIFLNISPLAGHLWFLYALVYCYILVLILNKYDININKLYKYIPILLFVSIILGEFSIFTGRQILPIYIRNFWMYALPYFLMGYLINERKIYNKVSNKSIYLIGILSIISVIIERLGVSKYDMYIGTISLSIVIFIWCINNANISGFNILAWIGKNISSYIYLLHLSVLWILENMEKQRNINVKDICYINTVMVFVITVIISVFIYMCKKVYANYMKKIQVVRDENKRNII